MQPHSFAITTRQAARLRGVEPHKPYSHFKRYGHWDGVVPIKLPNGRLLWNKADILRAGGIIPANSDMTPEALALMDWARSQGLPVDESIYRAACALGARCGGTSSDPAGDVECTAMLTIVEMWGARVTADYLASQGDSAKRLRAFLPAFRSALDGIEGLMNLGGQHAAL